MNKKNYLMIAALLAASAQAALQAAQLNDWPRITSAVKRDNAIEARVREIVAGMTLRQKIGQMTQAEIGAITPDEVREYYIGSVLNGGGSWPGKNKYAKASDWVALADRFHEASMATDMKVKVPVIWGIDAIHGNSNVHGATLYPHNIGLGAAHDKRLVGRMGQDVARAVRATGINWVFAPTLATVRDDRWGRTYESFSEDPALVKDYAAEYVKGLQGGLRGDGNVIATAKHFIGDGATDQGKDQGNSLVSRADMINIYGQPYYAALAAGAQTVMASYNSWNDVSAGVDYGKMHGSKEMLTDALKTRMGFDGFVVSDWNGIGQVKGCTNDSCARAINAGIDMVMVPTDWKAFIANTVRQVEAGEIAMSRIDDAVGRILRVKLRAGMFGKKPSSSSYAGKQEALQDRALARELVRKSLVLLKNDTGALPLARGKRILVVGEGADSLPLQTGGWSLSWQGNGNQTSDFPFADTILAGIVEANGKDKVVYSADAAGVDVSAFDAVIAVLAESPYAEGAGDIVATGTLRHTSRYPHELEMLQRVAGKGKPVVTVLLSGRPLWTNDVMNLSDSFVAAWLPGTEGKGVADVLFKGGQPFSGKLSFSWPKTACQAVVNVGDRDYAPLFKVGYGLASGVRSQVGQLDAAIQEAGCGDTTAMAVYVRGNHASWPLAISSGGQRLSLGRDLANAAELPGIKVESGYLGQGQDGKRVTWTGPARFEARASAPRAVPAFAAADGALRFDTVIAKAPAGTVHVGFGSSAIDLTRMFARFAGQPKQTVTIPLACFTARGANLSSVDTAFSVESDGQFAAVFGDIEVVGGAAKDAALACADLK
jgi:beta-glucosidase